MKANQRDFTVGQGQNCSQLNKNFMWSLQSTQKQNTPILSNYSSCATMSFPKEIMQKAIQAKNHHINELMDELKQAKSSYQQFKFKLSQQNSKLKEQNLILRQKLDSVIKQKDYLKKSIIKLQQQRSLSAEKVKSFHQENHLNVTELTRKIQQLQEENKKMQKAFMQQEKLSQQLKHQRDQFQAKTLHHQKQLQLHKTQQSLEIQKLKQIQIRLSEQNASLKQEIEKFQERKKHSKKYDKKLSRLEQKIACIIDTI